MLWILEKFVASTVLLGVLVLFLLYANLVLLFVKGNRPTASRPLDTAFVHAPLRLFLVMPLTLFTWQSLLIALGAPSRARRAQRTDSCRAYPATS